MSIRKNSRPSPENGCAGIRILLVKKVMPQGGPGVVSRNLPYVILGCAGACACAAGLILYLARARRRWSAIIAEALCYHRYHFDYMVADMGVDPPLREYARALRRAIDQQLNDDIRRGLPGLKGIVFAFTGGPCALQIVAEVYYQIFRHRRMDETMLKLLDTARSALYRFYLVHSIVMPLALVFMDLSLIRARIRNAARGPAGLYRVIDSNMRAARRYGHS
jgi:hypothetical protein